MQFDFPEILILLLIGLLFFKENILSWISQRLGYDSHTQAENIQTMQGDMTHLRIHFNDELTAILTEMQNGDRQFRETQLTQCGKLDEIRDSLRDISRNGIRIRK